MHPAGAGFLPRMVPGARTLPSPRRGLQTQTAYREHVCREDDSPAMPAMQEGAAGWRPAGWAASGCSSRR